MTTTFNGPTGTPVSPALRKNADKIIRDIRANHERSNIAKAHLLDRIAEFDQLELAGLFGATSTGSWLTREMHYPSSTAYEYVHVGTKLRAFPLIKEAFQKAELDYSTVRFLLKYVTEDSEAELLSLAKRLCFSELKRALSGVEPNDGSQLPADEPYFDLFERPDGLTQGRFLLPPVPGALLRSALKIAELALNGHAAPDAAQLQELIDELTSTGHASGDPSDDPAPCEDDYEFAEDATEAMAETFAEEVPATWDDEDFSFEDPEEANPGVMVQPPHKDTTITAEKLMRIPSRFGPPQKQNLYAAFLAMINMVRSQPITATRAPGADVTIIVTEDGRAWMPQNPQVPSSALIGYVHNALTRGHLLNGNGVTLHYGRKRRMASDGQVKALLELWGNQCAMPGCTHSRFMEIHHIHDWANGGVTDIENLIPLCSSCHSKVSHGSASITPLGPDLEFRFYNGARFVAPNRSLPEIT
ncbi:HNH endonuclease [Corynebacterium sp. CNCTC7651]|uniref:HNH endonuclease signature motif containing protein n=1 Tax=Corynebacterium sp. CNCTC7651 TaxID=2815361 RepID=UPI001F2EB129|nr:HNH endonuclease signature motif containing protein [Corynebacterium sp. CNCTC7651]UIZ91327.1 HNH endonuclease [Corynebacterium sp. CNCTC7651]